MTDESSGKMLQLIGMHMQKVGILRLVCINLHFSVHLSWHSFNIVLDHQENLFLFAFNKRKHKHTFVKIRTLFCVFYFIRGLSLEEFSEFYFSKIFLPCFSESKLIKPSPILKLGLHFFQIFGISAPFKSFN